MKAHSAAHQVRYFKLILVSVSAYTTYTGHESHCPKLGFSTALAMTGDLIPIGKKAKKSKSTDKVVEPESTEDQPTLKTDGGKSDKLFQLLTL